MSGGQDPIATPRKANEHASRRTAPFAKGESQADKSVHGNLLSKVDSVFECVFEACPCAWAQTFQPHKRKGILTQADDPLARIISL